MLRLPNNYILDSDCVELLIDHLKSYILHYYKDNNLHEQGFNIYLHNYYFRTTYKNHVYNISIVRIKGLFYYYLQHKKEQFIILATSPQSFNTIINKIKELNNRLYKDKK